MAPTIAMEVRLLPSLKEQMEAEVAAGNYDTENDIVNAALSYLFSCPSPDPYPPEVMKRLLQVGADQADSGQISKRSIEDIIAEGHRLSNEKQGRK